MAPAQTRGRAVRFALSPLVQMASAGLNALAVIIASRTEQLDDIAAFAAGGAVAGIASVLAGGGTSLLFVTGSALEQRAVRWVRWRLTAPAMMITSFTTDLILSRAGSISWPAMLFGSTAVIMQSLAALESTTLQRAQLLTRWAACVLLARVIPVGLVLAGLKYSLAMAVGSLALLLLLLLAVRGIVDQSARIAVEPLSTRQTVKLAYRPSFSALSILDAALTRAPFLAAPLAADATTAGAFAALLTAEQGLTAVFTTSLYTIMTIRSGNLDSSSSAFYRRLERTIVAASIPVALVAVAAGPIVLGIFGLTSIPDVQSIWAWISLSLPFVILNRSLQYVSMSQRDAARAIMQLATTTVGILVVAAAAWLLGSIVVLSASTAVGEALGIGAWLTAGLMKRRTSHSHRFDTHLTHGTARETGGEV